MAQQLVKRIWCDQHLQAKDEEVPGESWQVTLNGSQVDIDLCDECAAPLAELRAFLDLYGRAQVKRGRPRSPSTVELDECPVCGKNLRGRKGVMSHMRNLHDTTLEAWLAEHTDAPAPDKACSCGRVFSSQAGLARHQTTQGHQ